MLPLLNNLSRVGADFSAKVHRKKPRAKNSKLGISGKPALKCFINKF